MDAGGGATIVMEGGFDMVRAEGAVGNRLLPVSREREGSARRERKVVRDEVVLGREAAREEVCGCGVGWFQCVVSRERKKKNRSTDLLAQRM